MHHHILHIHNHVYSLVALEVYLKTYGYVFLFLGTLLEGELVLLLAGFFAYAGILNFWWVLFIGFLGATLGDNIWYIVGRKAGPGVIEKYGKYFMMSPKRIARAQKYFNDHGTKTIFFSRFVFGTRITSAILAGAFGMSRKTFYTTNVMGAGVWAIITTLLGYFFGRSFQVLLHALRRTETVLLILVIAAIIILILRMLVRKNNDA